MQSALLLLLPALTSLPSDFQLAFSPKSWKAERTSWRAVIQLNLIRSINIILDLLSQELPKHPAQTTSPVSSPFLRATSSSSDSSSSDPSPLQFSPTHALLKLRLAPLRRVEDDLKRLIGAGTDEITENPNAFSAFPTPVSINDQDDIPERRRPSEFYVRNNASWREAVRSAYHRISGNELEGTRSSMATADGSKLEGATEIIASCAEDMDALWKDPVVRDLLRRRRIRIELSPGL